jgi:tetratricopeptide (TPR) repeat protein
MPTSPEVNSLLQRGIAAAKAGQKQEARQVLLRVTELDEENEQAWLWLSAAVESIEERRICLENVLTINPHNRHAQSGLHWLDQQASPILNVQERCPRCGEAVPPSGTDCRSCGQVLIVACPACGHYVDARQRACPECGEGLGDYGDGGYYHLALAQAYLAHHRGERVEEAVARAIAEAPDDAQVLGGVAAVYKELGQDERAIATYKRAIESDPSDSALYARLGTIYLQRQMLAEARDMYERAAEQADDDPEILFELAQLQLEQEGETQETLDLLKKTTSLAPDHAEGHILLGDVYLARGQGAYAVRHYRRACELTEPHTALGREARHRLTKWGEDPRPKQDSQGWAETLRRIGGLMLIPVLAALANAGLVPWHMKLAAWVALVMASAGAYLWVCATDVPLNPGMQAAFGPKGIQGLEQKALIGIPGAVLWGVGMTMILLLR